MKIFIDPESFELSSRNVVGKIFVANNTGDFFPDDSWYDFPVVILQWWIKAIERLLDGATMEELLFMEGPYSIVLESRGKASLKYTWRRNESDKGSGSVALNALLADAKRAGRDVVQKCEKEGWVSSDLVRLRSAVS